MVKKRWSGKGKQSFAMVAAWVRVPDSSAFSQLNLHETDETKVA